MKNLFHVIFEYLKLIVFAANIQLFSWKLFSVCFILCFVRYITFLCVTYFVPYVTFASEVMIIGIFFLILYTSFKKI
jgi:hypothetical protein